MTAQAAMARESALSFEAKKTGFGQAQDGWSLTLRIQDIDVPDSVAKAKKGTRFMVVLVEIGDNEEPVSPHQAAAIEVRGEATPRPAQPTLPASAGDDKPRKSPAQIAGYLCTTVPFHTFLRERFLLQWQTAINTLRGADKPPYGTVDVAAECVRYICNVDSRANITKDNADWSALLLAFRLWENHPELEDA